MVSLACRKHLGILAYEHAFSRHKYMTAVNHQHGRNLERSASESSGTESSGTEPILFGTAFGLAVLMRVEKFLPIVRIRKNIPMDRHRQRVYVIACVTGPIGCFVFEKVISAQRQADSVRHKRRIRYQSRYLNFLI